MKLQKKPCIAGTLTPLFFILACLSLPAPALYGQSSTPGQTAAPSDSGDRKPLDAQQVFEKWKSSVFTIKTDSGQGTGFQTEQGILTCYHVIAGAKTITANLPGKPPVPLTNVIALDKDLDFALLAASKEAAEPTHFDPSEIKVGDPLYVIGSPEGLDQTLTEGILSGRRTEGGIEYLQMSAAVSHGSSGSPVFNQYGDVIGMVALSLEEGQQLNFAVSMHAIQGRLKGGIPITMLARSDKDVALSPDLQAMLSRTDKLRADVDSNIPFQLRDVPELELDVVDLPKDLSGRVSKSDILQWATTEMAAAAPHLHLITDDALETKIASAPDPTDIFEWLHKYDRPILFIIVSTIYDTDAKTHVYDVDLHFNRDAITVIGDCVTATFWHTGVLGAENDPGQLKADIQGSIAVTIKEFAEKWVKANK
ncbi:MAG TPA: serine protease [Chthonomonadaceae bacterium]|nr:serine protease [Chthonomonadaceae bacterium]